MRSSGKRRGERGRVLILSVLSLWCSAPVFGSEPPQESLNVKTNPAGGVIATAQVLFPAGPEIIHSLLTDFPRWPDLFEVRMRLVGLQTREDVVTTDLRIEHALLPGERRLVTESTVSPQGIVTDLIGGDFKQYHRVWSLSPANGGKETYAHFELLVAIDSIVPDWLVALATKRELEAHFRIVKEKARARAANPGK